MSDQPYYFGDTVKFKTTITVAGTLTDPGDLVLTIRKPDGSITTVLKAALNHESLGVYSHSLPVDQSGTWAYRFVASGGADGAREEKFGVRNLETV